MSLDDRSKLVKLVLDKNAYLCYLWLGHEAPYLDHLALAAIFAIRDRSSAVSFKALAGPPFLPPSFPRATAAGFFWRFRGVGIGVPVACATMLAANWLRSDGFFCFIMLVFYTAQA